MPSTFDFATAGRILFGAGRSAELSARAAGLGGRTLLCTGGRPERWADLTRDLPQVRPFSVVGEPTVELVEEAVREARAHRADLVVAVGGGSVLDTGKAVAALLHSGTGVLDHLEVVGDGRPLTAPAAAMIAVPTTAGTGSEVTANAVVRSVTHRRKASLRGPQLLPTLAIVDPLLTLDCPPAVTAASGLDALTQCLEPFVSRRATPLTDGFCREGVLSAATGLRQAFDDGADVQARTDVALCSLMGGLALANSGLGAVHGLAGVVGGTVDAPHGAVCGALLAPTVRTNLEALTSRAPDHPALFRYREAFTLLAGDADDGPAWIEDLVAHLDVPPLRHWGLTPELLERVAAEAQIASSTKANPIELSLDELYGILGAAL